MKRIIISGGPSSGKTTLIEALKKSEICFHEISRDLIKEAQLKGISQPFLEDPLAFNEALLAGRIAQFKKAEVLNGNRCFYDRGIPDVLAYMNYGNQPVPKDFQKAFEMYRYDSVFLLPPWREIHLTDNERYESFEQASIIYDCLVAVYRKQAALVVEVPTGSVTERISFIKSHL